MNVTCPDQYLKQFTVFGDMVRLENNNYVIMMSSGLSRLVFLFFFLLFFVAVLERCFPLCGEDLTWDYVRVCVSGIMGHIV